MKRHTHIYTLFLLLAAAVVACSCSSRKNNTAKTRIYHAFFARYNTFYNGNKSFEEGVKLQGDNHKDNYLEILPVLIYSNKNTTEAGKPNFERAIEKSQKAIKNHSIKRKPKKPAGKKLSEKKKRFFAQKEFNPFLWRAWFMMADSYFNKGEFTEAASTYIYIARLYENNPDIVAKARIGLAKCYAEIEWYYECEDLLNRIKRDSLPKSLEREHARARANMLVKQKRYDEAIPYIEKAVKRKGATDIDQAREYYLLGQLYKNAGNDKGAFKNFGQAISKNPPYELEFNARIRQTESITTESKKSILRKLNRMARSSKNKSYLSQIYYAIGNVHMNEKDTAEAVKAYEKGLKEGDGTGYGSGMLHLSLGKIFWQQEKFTKAKESYSKAKQLLGDASPEKDNIEFRNGVLQELAQHSESIEKQSELLYWASLSEEQLLPIIDKLIEEAKEREKEQKKLEKKERRQTGRDLEAASTNATMAQTSPEASKYWYFYNPTAVSRGIRTFAGEWENRELKDFWRLSNGVVFSNENDSIDSEGDEHEGGEEMATDSIAGDSDQRTAAGTRRNRRRQKNEAGDSLSQDPTTREYYLAQIPNTEEKQQEAHEVLREALLGAGIVFKDKAGDKELAIKYLEKVATNYPEYEKLPDAYYHLFLACSRWNEPEKAAYYKELLIAGYPDNELAVRIQKPGFFETAATRKHNEDSIYVKAYEHYTNGEYAFVESENTTAKELYPDGKHRARFMFIDAMSKLYSGKQQEALDALKALVLEHGADSLSSIAGEVSTGIEQGRLLRSGISLSIWERRSDGTIKSGNDSVPAFGNERSGAHYFVLAYPKDSLDEKRLLFEVAKHNFSRYMVRNFVIETKELEHISLMQVKEFLNFDEAYLYRKRLYESGSMAQMLEGINAFIISKANLDLLLQYYSFNDYEKFYEENLMNIPELEIDGYTLDEPDYGPEEEDNNTKEKE